MAQLIMDTGIDIVNFVIHQLGIIYFVAIDTTQGTDTNRVQLYVNGTLVSASVGVDYGSFPQNYDTRINDNKQHNIGKKYNANYIDGLFMAEINFVDGLSFFSDTSGTANTSFNVNSFR